MTDLGDARLPARFWAKVDPQASGCWRWTASKKMGGYGQYQLEGWPQLAHRVAYEYLVGPIPAGLTIDHLCRNRWCVNPEHLEPVTQRENNLRGGSLVALNARKTHCKRGHPLSGPNLYIHPTAGARQCRICMQAREQRRGPRRAA